MPEETGTEPKLSPLERAKLAKAEAEKRKQEQVEQAEVERLAAEKSVEDSAREQAEQRAQAETKVGECHSIVDAKQVECDEIAAMAAEGGDEEFIAAMAEAQSEAKAALEIAQAELHAAETALEFLTKDEVEDNEGTKQEVEVKPEPTAVEILSKAYADSWGMVTEDFSEVLKGRNSFAKPVENLVTEAGPDLDGRVQALQEKMVKLPEMWGELNSSLKALEDQFKSKFGKGIEEALVAKNSPKRPSVTEVLDMVSFIENDPATKTFAEAYKEIANLNQEKLKIGLVKLSKEGRMPTSVEDRPDIDYAIERVLGAGPAGILRQAGTSLRSTYSYVPRIVSYIKAYGGKELSY